MTYVSTTLSAICPLAVGILFLLLLVMSKRLGEALEMPRYYRLYIASLAIILPILPAAWVLLLAKPWGLPEPDPETGFALKTFAASLPMSLAVTLALLATVKYWGWIWGEIRKGERKGGRR